MNSPQTVQVSPSIIEMSSFATLLVSHTWQHVLRREIDCLVSCGWFNSKTIWSYRSSWDSPWRSIKIIIYYFCHKVFMLVNSPAPSLVTNRWDHSWPVVQRVELPWQSFQLVWQAAHRLDSDTRLECSQTVFQTFRKFSAPEFWVIVRFPA